MTQCDELVTRWQTEGLGMKMTEKYKVISLSGQHHCGKLNENSFTCRAGLEKSSVLPVLDRFLKLKTDLFLDKKLKNRSIKPCISQDFAIHRLTLSPVGIVHT